MNPFNNQLARIAIFMFFPLVFFWKKANKIVMVILLLCTLLLSSCFQHYFRSSTQARVDVATIRRLMSIEKIFIIHFKKGVGELQNLTISNDKLEADIINVSPEHLKHINLDTAKANRVKKADK